VSYYGPLFAFLSSFVWAIGSSRYSRLAASYSPFAISLSRALVAGTLFFLMCFVEGGGIGGGFQMLGALTSRQVLWFSLSMFCSYGFADALFLWSTRSLGVPAALALASSYPLWTALGGMFFRGDDLALRAIAGTLLVVIGNVVVILNAPRLEPSGRLFTRRSGVILALLTSLLWAANSLIASTFGAEVPVPASNTVRMLAAVVICFVLGRLFSPSARAVFSRRDFVRSLWLFAYEAFLGSYFFMYGLGHSSLVVGVTLSCLAPVIAVPVAWLMGTEKPSLHRTIGIITVVAGVVLVVG